VGDALQLCFATSQAATIAVLVITVSSYRCEMLHCNAEKDFLAKLHCVRQAFDVSI